jgi:NDP-sugar pyrophosphorylase family protein
VRAVILAGGRGTRLAPYTTLLPKPLMPVGDMPIIELLVRRLSEAGVDRVTIAVGHLASLIQAYLGSQSNWGLEIDYSLETQPLGTAGPLALVPDLTERFLVMNGDLLTDLDFNALTATHEASGASATIGTYRRDVRIDLGVIKTSQGLVVDYQEKPSFQFLVSMGVYVLEPGVLDLLTPGLPCDLPDLVKLLLARGGRVASHVHDGYWLDIGRPDDFERAQRDYEEIKTRLLPASGAQEG